MQSIVQTLIFIARLAVGRTDSFERVASLVLLALLGTPLAALG